MKNKDGILIVNSISEQHRILGLPQPEHPLISIIEFENLQNVVSDEKIFFTNKFYTITLKKECASNQKYGRNTYDFDEGFMNFCNPDIKHSWDKDDNIPTKGWLLSLHQDFLITHPLSQKIKDFGFFQYAINEALHLSLKEEKMIETVLRNIQQEYISVIDSFSQDIIISQIETLLNYANRFYNRQFITRKNVNSGLLSKLNLILDQYFQSELLTENGIPSVKYIAQRMNISPNYLSDLLRNLTGQNTQQHIHNKLIEKAKEIILTSSLSVSEIAYQLGFEHTQSFNKLFKNKTKITPLEFKGSFN